jgi:hypothetical protein
MIHKLRKTNQHSLRVSDPYSTFIKENGLVSDCYLMPSEQFHSYIMARKIYARKCIRRNDDDSRFAIDQLAGFV